MPTMLKISGTIRSVQPITHSSNIADEGVPSQGNQIFHRKMKFFFEGNLVQVPVISGNSIRGIIRRLGAESFLKELGLDPSKLNRKLYYLLYSGGALETGEGRGKQKATKEQSPQIVSEELRHHIPLVSLLGCSYQKQILQGKVLVDFLIPYVDEIAELYGKPKPGIRSSQITDWLFYTRQDDLERNGKETTNQMIYQLEYVIPNIEFLHSFTLMGANEVETALFFHLVECLERFGRVGGKIAHGHGKVQFHYALSEKHSTEPYFEFIQNNRNMILSFLKTYWMD